MQIKKLKPILVVEDSQPDFEAIVRAFKKSTIDNPVYHCETGEDALDFLYKKKNYQGEDKAPRPGMILLDLNLPGLDGRNVLKQIKNDPALQSIPVIILTTSNSDKDIEDCYKNGANSYITKPVDWAEFLTTVHNFKEFWLETAILPDKEMTS